MPPEDQIKILEDKLRAANVIIEKQNDALMLQFNKLNKCRQAMKIFVDRVDRGEVRSKVTYEVFKMILEETK